MKSKSSTITRKGAASRQLPNVHPGEVLMEEFLRPMGISAYVLAKGTRLSQTRISEILHKKRSVTAETALRFSRFFGNSAEFWLGLQNDYDLEEGRIALRKELASIRSPIRPISPPRALSTSRAKFRKTLAKVSNRRPPRYDRV